MAPIARSAAAVTLLLVAACSSDGRELAEPRLPPPERTTIAPVPTTSITAPATEPPERTPSTAARTQPVVFDRLHSPANATVEATGTGAVPGDPVTVDGEPGDVLEFVADDDGAFTVRINVVEEGAHTVCVAATCGRVYTLAPDAESPEEVIAHIEQAIDLVGEIVPYASWFPDWTIEIGGAMSGTGGSTDPERRTIVVHRNRGRSVDDYVRTIIHELGHVVDVERLDDADRVEYVRLAGYPAGTPWSDPDARTVDEWARQPAEDFAEVLVAGWTDRRWLPRTRDDLDDELVAAAFALAGLDR